MGLLLVPADHNGARTVPLARFGRYEVRLTEFIPDRGADEPIWLELYDRDAQCGIDSCRCSDLEEAVVSAGHLVSRARELNTVSSSLSLDTRC
jgi:hypothetical protein